MKLIDKDKIVAEIERLRKNRGKRTDMTKGFLMDFMLQYARKDLNEQHS